MLIRNSGLAASKPVRKGPSATGKLVVDAPGRTDQRRFRVNVPAKDVDLPLGQQQRVPQRAEIGAGVVEDSYSACFTSLPDGPAGDEDR